MLHPVRLPAWRAACRAVLLAVLVISPAAGPARGDSPDAATWSPDRPEAGSVEQIRAATTSPRYLPASVAYVPASDRVPSPARVLGHLAGAADELSSVAQVHDYFRRLAAASDRIRIETIGTSEEGREILLALVSAPENLAQLDRYAAIGQRLADPRRTPPDTMRALVAATKPFYYVTGGLHSTETASPEMLMELAYRLVVSERPAIQAMRANLVVLITPILEVDGRDRQVQWYYRHLRGKQLPYKALEEFESAPYWGAYAFHDNNRDGMQLTLALSRAVQDTYFRFHPVVIHDLHESVPLLYISTGHGPYTRAADPLTIREWTLLADHDATVLEGQGLPGVWTWAFWDGWWPGYIFSVANNHNSIGRFYETFGNGMAGTFDRELKEERFAGKPVTEVQWYRPSPPEKKLRWSLRDNVNYAQAGVLASLEYTAQHGAEFLTDFYTKGTRAIDKGQNSAPYAWVFPPQQADATRLALLVRRLLAQHIEVRTLAAPFQSGTQTLPAGSYVVRLDQPYRNAALTFLDTQDFPADEPNPPYDDVAWTWPLLLGVHGERLDAPEILTAPMSEPLGAMADPAGAIRGRGEVFLLRDTGQTSLATARVLLGDHMVEAADTTFAAADTTFPAGSWILRAPRRDVAEVATRLGFDFTAVATVPPVRRHRVDLPRLAVLHTWIATQDCGWVRYALDHAQVPYTLIHDGDLRAGNLRRRFDVILFPDSWGDFAALVHGIDPKYGPLPYTRTAEYPSHGIPDASPDITGGMGFEGLLALQQFVTEGGVLVTLANAGTLAVDGGLARGVRRLEPGTVTTPGSVVQAKVLRPLHPLVYGYEATPVVFRGFGPLFEVEDADRSLVVLQFGTKQVPEADEQAVEAEHAGAAAAAHPDTSRVPARVRVTEGGTAKLVLSGLVKPKEKLDGLPAVLDVPAGKGHILLFAFNPMHRDLNHADFRFVYNAILNWDDLPPRP